MFVCLDPLFLVFHAFFHSASICIFPNFTNRNRYSHLNIDQLQYNSPLITDTWFALLYVDTMLNCRLKKRRIAHQSFLFKFQFKTFPIIRVFSAMEWTIYIYELWLSIKMVNFLLRLSSFGIRFGSDLINGRIQIMTSKLMTLY